MKFHFARKLIAVTALWGILGMSLAWGRSQKPPESRLPQRCSDCCPPTGCGGGQYFQRAVGYHSNLNTQQFHGTNVTSAQIAIAAGDLQLAKTELDQDGGMVQFTNVILQYASVFEAANPNFSYYFPEMVKLGYIGTEADLLKFATTTTQAQRIAFVNQVRQGGMDSIFVTLIAYENALAKGQDRYYHSPDGGQQCQTAAMTAAWFGVAAGAATLLAAGGVAPAVGIAAVFGFVSVVFTMDYVMMGC
jgi:hypothetical protein